MISDNASKEDIKKAEATIAAELKLHKDIRKALNSALNKTKKTELREIIEAIKNAVDPFLGDPYLITNAQKKDLANTLEQIPQLKSTLADKIYCVCGIKTNDLIRQPFIYKIRADYKAANRFHALEASSQGLSEKYKNFKGDYLKEKILNDFKQKLENCTSEKLLNSVVKEIVNSKEYEILAKGQGLFTNIFGLRTSSVEAFNEMTQDMRGYLEKSKVFYSPPVQRPHKNYQPQPDENQSSHKYYNPHSAKPPFLINGKTNPYSILGLDEASIDSDNASQLIKTAYKKMALKYHPDRNLENTVAAQESFKEVSEAFQFLSNSKNREIWKDWKYNQQSENYSSFSPA